jgi:hypothetical protein
MLIMFKIHHMHIRKLLYFSELHYYMFYNTKNVDKYLL